MGEEALKDTTFIFWENFKSYNTFKIITLLLDFIG